MIRLIPCSIVFCFMALGITPAMASNTNEGTRADRGVEWIFADRFEAQPPNILLVIMDDVGIDQMPPFGYGGATEPSMPSIDAIAEGGLRFRNTWSMPECSPGRSILFSGRYPLRNNIYQAIGPNDLANSQLSQYEETVPKLLDHAGYESAMFGKFHLAGPENNAAENSTPDLLGWDHFYGWTGGLPASIDTTAGGVAPEGTYSCGFVPDTQSDPEHGADAGACYIPEDADENFSCTELSSNAPAGDPPGLQCLTDGGIFVPDARCEAEPPGHLAWNRQNAHYVSPLVINNQGQVEEVSLLDPRSRGYRSTIEVDAAVEWINQRSGSGEPWMATVSFSAAHTPLHQAPFNLLPSGVADDLTADCTDALNTRRLSDAMIEAMDTELGRLLVETGIAESRAGGLAYDPAASDTVVVVYGDNGTFGPVVKAPFDPQRAKGTAYQTGIWVPLIISGPMVDEPGRQVEHMVNGVDVYQLFGELAGLNVPSLVPRPLDSVSMMPYLSDPNQFPLREFNFAQGGLNIQANGGVNGPCVFSAQCSHTPTSKNVCEDNGGVWWGKGADDPEVIEGDLEQCWQVNQAIYHDDPDNYEDNRIPMGWTVYQTVRNEQFKLIYNSALDYDPTTDDSFLLEVEELYHIDQGTPPLLDTADRNLLEDDELGPVPAANYAELRNELDAILASRVECPGDGNDDGQVDQTDVDNYHDITADWNGSSSYDFDLDGHTDEADLQIIEDHLGTVCFTDES